MIIDPILEESDKHPVVRPGTAVVAFDGSQTRRASAGAGRAPGPAPAAEDAVSREAQPLFDPENRVGRMLARSTDAAGSVGSRLARASGKFFVDAARRSSFGAALFGQGERYFLVDTSRKSAEIGFNAPSARIGMSFRIEIDFVVRVADPEAIIREGVRDLVGHFAPALKRRAERAVLDFSPTQSAEARAAVEKELGDDMSDDCVSLSGIAVRVDPDETALALIRQENEVELRLAAIRAKSRVDDAERRALIDAITRPEHAMAAWIATDDVRYREIWIGQVQARQGAREETMALLQLGLEKKIIERHEIGDAFPNLGADLVRELMAGAAGPLSGGALFGSQGGNGA